MHKISPRTRNSRCKGSCSVYLEPNLISVYQGQQVKTKENAGYLHKLFVWKRLRARNGDGVERYYVLDVHNFIIIMFRSWFSNFWKNISKLVLWKYATILNKMVERTGNLLHFIVVSYFKSYFEKRYRTDEILIR